MKAAIPFASVATLLLAGLVAAPARAQADAAPRAERARIADERAAAQARFGERQRECLQRFVVTSCVEEAQRDRRETLARLRREQNLLDEKQRQARAAERNEAIRKKADAEAARDREAAGRARPDRRAPVERAPRIESPAEAASAPLKTHSQPGKASSGGRATKIPQRSAQDAARSRATFDATQRAAAAHRAEVEERNIRRAATHKPAAPLPLPADAPPR